MSKTNMCPNFQMYMYEISCRPPDEIPRAFYENSGGGKEKEALGSNGVMADLNIGLTIHLLFCVLSILSELLSSTASPF